MTPRLFAPLGRRLLLVGAGLLSCALACAVTPEPGAPRAAVELQLQARLFHSASGSFSADVLAPGAPELFNVVASQDPSTATLVLVAVKLAPDTVLRSDTPLRLTVRELAPQGQGQRLMLDRSQRVGALPRGGTAHLAFWLQGTGCRALRLQVKMAIAGQAAPLAATATVPFACSE
ncbi:MAG TPA: hypothetical protein VFL64_19880 [Rhizobacter sp.]|nr:hypothetical protein [Rhizobacter sp.]